MRRNWFVAAIVIGIVAIVIAVIAMRLSDDGSRTGEETTGACAGRLLDESSCRLLPADS